MFSSQIKCQNSVRVKESGLCRRTNKHINTKPKYNMWVVTKTPSISESIWEKVGVFPNMADYLMQKHDERWSGDRREWLRATVSHTIRLKCNNAPCSADIYPRQGCQVVLLGKNSDLENTESCVRN